MKAMEGLNKEDLKIGDMDEGSIDEYLNLCSKALVGEETDEIRESVVGDSVQYLDRVMQRFERRLITATTESLK